VVYKVAHTDTSLMVKICTDGEFHIPVVKFIQRPLSFLMCLVLVGFCRPLRYFRLGKLDISKIFCFVINCYG
jgi:hypothetical protein